MDTKKTDKTARTRAVVKTDKTTRTGPVLKTGKTARYRRASRRDKKTGKTTRTRPAKKTDKPKPAKTGAVVRNSVDVVNQEEDGAHAHHYQAIQRQPLSSISPDNLLGSAHGPNRGLESLAMVDQLILKQEVEIMEVATGIEEANKYTVLDTDGNVMFTVEEETSCCNRSCCGVCRSFDVLIMDTLGKPIIHMMSPNTCNCCCLRRIEVQSPPGTIIGYAKQQFTWFYPKIIIQKGQGEAFFAANGPFCALGKCVAGDADFVLTRGKEKIGKVSKKWGGATQEIFTDVDTFGITFRKDLDTTTKALLLATAILIDFAFFEDN